MKYEKRILVIEMRGNFSFRILNDMGYRFFWLPSFLLIMGWLLDILDHVSQEVLNNDAFYCTYCTRRKLNFVEIVFKINNVGRHSFLYTYH